MRLYRAEKGSNKSLIYFINAKIKFNFMIFEKTMKIKEITNYLEEIAPLNYAEDFDNVGLLVGDANIDVSGVLVTLDTLEKVVEEAIEKNCNLIISFHPIIFGGLKKLTGKTYVERVVQKAIKNDIAIYAIHTALDNHKNGVNDQICNKLGLINREILVPQEGTIKKLTTYVPNENVEEVREALFTVGAGSIGNYNHCSFNIKGKGSFLPNENADPHTGQKGQLHLGEETQINITFLKHLESQVLKQLFKAHPYEEVAYEITSLHNKNQDIGIGMMGEFEKEVPIEEAMKKIKSIFNTKSIRHSKFHQEKVKSIAVLGGSGAFAINNAIAKKADIYMTADMKYHDFYKAENKITLVDVGHYESEQYTKDLLCALLQKKFHNFAIVLSNINTNPIQYF